VKRKEIRQTGSVTESVSRLTGNCVEAETDKACRVEEGCFVVVVVVVVVGIACGRGGGGGGLVDDVWSVVVVSAEGSVNTRSIFHFALLPQRSIYARKEKLRPISFLLTGNGLYIPAVEPNEEYGPSGQ
jgi:hypothetical protein